MRPRGGWEACRHDGEKLLTIQSDSQDFIIANHMLEHCKNPIQTLINFLSKIRSGGRLYVSIPDKRFTYDKERPLTEFSHLMEDFNNPSDENDFQHYLEWSEFPDNKKEPEQIQSQAKELFDKDYSIHFHVWDPYNFMEFLVNLNKLLNNKFSILIFTSGINSEIISILEKNH